MRWTPHITVAAIVARNDTFLMVSEHEQGQLVINQPAGHVEPNESILDALHREVLEETAFTVRAQHLVGIYRYLSESNGIEYLRFCYACEPLENTHRALDDDIEAAEWLTREEILKRPHRSHLVSRCIDDFDAGHRAPLYLIYWDKPS